MNERPIHVLVASDRKDTYRQVNAHLERATRSSFNVDWCHDYTAALNLPVESGYDVILVDYRPGSDGGGALLDDVQKIGSQIPLIVLTGDPEKASTPGGTNADYLAIEELSRPLLELAIRYALERNRAKRRRRLQSTALQAAANAVMITDRQGTIVWVNPAFTRLTGYSSQEVIGRNPRLLSSGRQGEAFYRELWETILAGRAWEGELINQRKDGSIYTERQTITPVRDEQGRISHFIAIKYDITEWKETEAALHESETLRRLAVEGAELGTWGLNLVTSEAYLDARAREFLGLEPHESPTVELLTARIHPDDREKTSQAFQKALNSTTTGNFTIEQRVIHPDGSVRWMETMGRVQFQGKGKEREAAHIVGVLMDVTERKQAKEELLLQTARVQALARAAERLNAQLDLDAVMQAVMEEAVGALDVPAASVTLYDEASGDFFWAADHGLPPAYRQREIRYSRELIDALAEEIPLVATMPGVRDYPELPSSDLHVEADVRSFATAIMQREGQFVGALTVYTIGHKRDFAQHELALLQAVADQAAQAITNARLYQQAQQRLQRLRALNAIDRAITARFDLEETLNIVLEQVMDTLGADGATIFLRDSETDLLTFAACRGFRGDAIRHAQAHLGQGYGGRAASERRTIHVPDLAKAENLRFADIVEEEGFVSYVGAPLVTDDNIVGILSLLHREPFSPGEDWLSFLEALALQAAVVIDNHRLLAETQRLLQQTREQAEQTQQILDAVPEGVLLLDKKRRIVLANPAGQTYLEDVGQGAQPGQVLEKLGGKPLQYFLNSVTLQGSWQELQPHDSPKIYEVGLRQLREGPQTGGWVIVLRDVTEERAQHEYLQAQQRLAAVGQLAAGISHDFNNIMAAIVLYAQLLQRKYNDDGQDRQALDVIYTQAQHASQLTRQILDFSRRSVSERRPINLIPLLKEQKKLWRRTFPENITLDLQSSSDEYIVNADPTQAQQVAMNLAINARDAMPEGGKLTVRLSQLTVNGDEQAPLPEMEAGRWLQLDFVDTGAGIPNDVLPRIFEPFFTTKAPNEGSGLGLAQVYGIVKQHEGHITVESTPGTGTTFIIYLPLPPSVTDEEASRQNARASMPLSQQQVTVFLAEDEKETRQAIAAALESLGMQVIAVDGGQAALDWFEQNPGVDVDAILGDVIMPDVSGRQLYQALCTKRPELQMILMSGYSPAEDLEALLERSNVHWIQKPFTLEDIAEKITGVLDQ